MNAVETIILIALALGIWYPLGSWAGRRLMRRKASTCIERGSLRIITPSSILVEHKIPGYKYIGIYIEWLPFENPFNLAAKLAVRRNPIAVIKIQPEEPIPGEANITKSEIQSSGGELIGGYRAIYRGISKQRLKNIVEALQKTGFDKLVIGSKPNITIITRIKGQECINLLENSLKLVKEISGE
ncbi:MAG TPA: hypothetical protein VNL13_01235 [Sulfolobales archaeon]|nr:hypothetical protein [Sulfolobales archaeon]